MALSLSLSLTLSHSLSLSLTLSLSLYFLPLAKAAPKVEKIRMRPFLIDVGCTMFLRLLHLPPEPLKQARLPVACKLRLHVEVLGAKGSAKAPAQAQPDAAAAADSHPGEANGNPSEAPSDPEAAPGAEAEPGPSADEVFHRHFYFFWSEEEVEEVCFNRFPKATRPFSIISTGLVF